MKNNSLRAAKYNSYRTHLGWWNQIMLRFFLLILMCFSCLVWESKINVPEGLYSLAVLCVMAWSRNCVLQGTSHRICLYLFPLCEIRCSGKDQLTDWNMSKDPDTYNGTVCLYFFEIFEGAVLWSWFSFYFDQYVLCAVCLNRPQASPGKNARTLLKHVACWENWANF